MDFLNLGRLSRAYATLVRLIRNHLLQVVVGLALFTIAFLLVIFLLPYQREQSIARRFQALAGDVKVPVSFESIGPKWLSPSTANRLQVFHRITGLILTDAAIPSDLLSEIGTLKSLKSISFNCTRNTDEMIGSLGAALTRLPNLKQIYFEGSDVTGIGLAYLENLTDLESLQLSGLQITDAEMAHLKGLKNLRFLGLDDTSVGDKGLEDLKSFTKLKNLNLSYTMVTDDGLKHLTGLSNLRTLQISERITEGGWNMLCKKLPDCKIGPKPSCQVEPEP